MEVPLLLQPILILVVSAVLVPPISLLGKALKFERLREVFTIAGFIVAFYSLCNVYLKVSTVEGHLLSYHFKGLGPPFGVTFIVDWLSIFMAFLFCGLGLMAAIYSIRYMEEDTGLDKYYTLLLTLVAGLIGVSFAGDFFNFFVFWETFCISSYVLVTFRIRKWEPVEAGFKYLIMGTFGSLLVLLAMSYLYGLTGTLSFPYIAKALSTATVNPVLLYFLIGLLLTGFGIGAAVAPFHTWLPDAHPAAPSPISAMLSGVVIKAAVYGIIRILAVVLYPVSIDWGIIVIVVAIFATLTMTVGNVMALLQDDIKRLLAFSSVAQMGYIMLAISVGLVGGVIGLYGLTAGLLHVMNHAIMKGLLFLCAGALLHAAGTRNLKELTGIGHKMPVTAVVLAVGALAISGIPPFNGFVSELAIILASINAGMGIFAAIMLANIIIGFSYYLKLLYILVWQSPTERVRSVKEAPVSMLFPMVILMILCIIIGVWPQPFIGFASQAAEAALNPTTYIRI